MPEEENISEKINKIKNNSAKVFMDLDFIQSLFIMLDTDKYLLFNSTNAEQEKAIRHRKNAIKKILEKLYVPLPIETA